MIRSIQNALSPIHFLLFPQQRWLTKQFRRTWMDKDEIIRTTIFESVVHWVEVEGKDEMDADWSEDLAAGHVTAEYVKDKKKFIDRIMAIYLWHTHDRGVLQKEHEELTNQVFDTLTAIETVPKKFRTGFYKKMAAIEKKIKDTDSKHMKTVIDLSGYLWT